MQYQRQLAIQRMQEQEREMQMRQEQQKQQYQVVQPGAGIPTQGPYPPQHAFVPPTSQNYTAPMPPPTTGNGEMPPQQPYPNFKAPQIPGDFRQPYNMQGNINFLPINFSNINWVGMIIWCTKILVICK